MKFKWFKASIGREKNVLCIATSLADARAKLSSQFIQQVSAGLRLDIQEYVKEERQEYAKDERELTQLDLVF